MKDNNSVETAEVDLAWLENDYPEVYHLLAALDGDLDALRWLKLRGDGLFLFVEALSGAKEAVDSLEAHPADKLSDLFDTIVHCGVTDWLRENHEELQRLFAFVCGDDSALRGLKQRRTTYKRVADIVRAKYRDYRIEDGEASSAVAEGAAADVGCLIGEMHLQQQEYHKAIEAFGRAIASDPTPDAYLGRARAYRALAALDDHSATEVLSQATQRFV